MRTPIKLDIEPGVEWLLPAAKRWLEQAKRVMRTPLGAKVFDLPGGERITVQWRRGLDYVRISGAAIGKIIGRSVNSTSDYRGFIWDAGNRVDMVNDASIRATSPLCVSNDGLIASGNASLLASPNPSRAFRWDKSTEVEVIASELLVGNVPRAGATLPYINTAVTTMSSDGSVIAGTRSATAQLFPEAFIWTRASGAIALGFISGLGTSPPYGFDEGNKSYPACMSEDGTVVFGYSGGENFFNGGSEPAIGARWTASTGWVRLPLVYAYPVSVSRANDAGTMVVGSTYDGTKSRPYLYSDINGAEILPAPWDAISVTTTAVGVSPNGKYIVGNIGTDRSCMWEIDQTTRAVTPTELPINRAVAVLDDGTVFGHTAPTVPGQYVPTRWSAAAGITLASIDATQYATVSDAGPAGAVGIVDVYGSTIAGAQGFFWPKSGGPIQLISTRDGYSYSVAVAISGGSND